MSLIIFVTVWWADSELISDQYEADIETSLLICTANQLTGIETSLLICTGNQLTGFFMSVVLAWYRLMDNLMNTTKIVKLYRKLPFRQMYVQSLQ